MSKIVFVGNHDALISSNEYLPGSAQGIVSIGSELHREWHLLTGSEMYWNLKPVSMGLWAIDAVMQVMHAFCNVTQILN